MTETPCNILLYEMGCSNNLFLIYKTFFFLIVTLFVELYKNILLSLYRNVKKNWGKILQIGPVGIQKICSWVLPEVLFIDITLCSVECWYHRNNNVIYQIVDRVFYCIKSNKNLYEVFLRWFYSIWYGILSSQYVVQEFEMNYWVIL